MQHFLMHLKLFYRKNKAIFLLMLMIQIMVACSMHYIFLKTQSSHYEIDAYQQDLKTFTITKTDGWSADEIKESFALLPFSAESAWIYDEQYNVKTYLIGEETELQKAIGHFDCDDFQYSEWQNGAYILRSVQHMYKTNSNPTCKVNDYEVTILGKCDDYLEKHSIIPNTVFEAAALRGDQIYITAKETINISDVELYHSDLQVIYPDAEIDDPIKRNYALEEAFEDKDILCFIMVLLAIFTEGYLLLYLRQKCTVDYEIFRILGSSNMQNAYYHAISAAAVLMIQSLLGTLLFRFVVLPLMARYDALLLLAFDYQSLTYPQLAILLFTIITCIPSSLYKGSPK